VNPGSSDATTEGAAQGAEGVENEPTLPELTLRDGLPDVIESADALAAYANAVGRGTGPVGLDAERASGYRYSMRAYLVQVRREGAGTALIDPIAVPDLSPLHEAIGQAEWILHAATQDLPCLAEVGMRPTALFDTEVAGRLLGRDRVSLAALVAGELGFGLEKGHGATDWSARPLSTAQLRYAALDVEPLVELRNVLREELIAADRWDIAQQEFHHLRSFEPRDKGPDPWRRLSGMHKLTSPRQWAIARELWSERDSIAQRTDIAPGRLIPDSAIVAAVLADPSDPGQMMTTKGFSGRGAGRYRRDWWAALERARALPKEQWPKRAVRADGPPPPKSWAEKDPQAAVRLSAARTIVTGICDAMSIAPELLLSPDLLRRLCWQPPSPLDEASVRDYLLQGGARPWQIGALLPGLVPALRG
jgi:ribonuclease D